MFSKGKSFRWALIAPVAILGLALGACGGDDDDAADDDNGGGITVATKTGGNGGSATQPSGGDDDDDKDAETITVVMTDNKFTPNKITVPVNKKITFVAKNEGAAVHNMKVLSKATEGKDYVSDALVNPETESKFSVTFKKTGTVKFQCDYHLPDMAGTIEVK